MMNILPFRADESQAEMASRRSQGRNQKTAGDFQSTMIAQLLKPALPRLVSAFSGGSSGASETIEQFASQVLSDALSRQIAERDPFGLTPAVLAEMEKRSSRAPGAAASGQTP